MPKELVRVRNEPKEYEIKQHEIKEDSFSEKISKITTIKNDEFCKKLDDKYLPIILKRIQDEARKYNDSFNFKISGVNYEQLYSYAGYLYNGPLKGFNVSHWQVRGVIANEYYLEIRNITDMTKKENSNSYNLELDSKYLYEIKEKINKKAMQGETYCMFDLKLNDVRDGKNYAKYLENNHLKNFKVSYEVDWFYYKLRINWKNIRNSQ